MGANEGQGRCVTGFYNKEARYRIRWLHLAFYSVLQDHRWPHNSDFTPDFKITCNLVYTTRLTNSSYVHQGPQQSFGRANKVTSSKMRNLKNWEAYKLANFQADNLTSKID